MSNLWQDRRQALLLLVDAMESRDAQAWNGAEQILWQARSAQPMAEDHLREDAPKRMEAMLTSEPVESFPLPFKTLNDCLLGGLRRGQTVVLAADTGQGKSQLTDQILEHITQSKPEARTRLYINEMAVAERDARWVQRRTGIAEERVLAAKLDDGEIQKVVGAAKQYPFDICEIAGESFRDVAERLETDRPDVAAIDMLHRFDYRDEKELRLGMGHLSDAALRANCALILVCHLNEKRVGESGIRPRPTLTDIRDSGTIKNFANVVLFLQRKQDEDEPANLSMDGELWLAKVRAGKQGGIRVQFDPKALVFTEPGAAAPEPEPEPEAIFGEL